MSEEDVALVGCISRDMEAKVPSVEVVCRDCGAELWVSKNMLEQVPNCTTLCIPCLIKAVADADEKVSFEDPEWQREQLREVGLSDADIDLAHEVGDAIIQLGVRHARDQ